MNKILHHQAFNYLSSSAKLWYSTHTEKMCSSWNTTCFHLSLISLCLECSFSHLHPLLLMSKTYSHFLPKLNLGITFFVKFSLIRIFCTHFILPNHPCLLQVQHLTPYWDLFFFFFLWLPHCNISFPLESPIMSYLSCTWHIVDAQKKIDVKCSDW